MAPLTGGNAERPPLVLPVGGVSGGVLQWCNQQPCQVVSTMQQGVSKACFLQAEPAAAVAARWEATGS
jgi:hypothetical protein